jgi:ABC-type Fe3+ transport system permease subunit
MTSCNLNGTALSGSPWAVAAISLSTVYMIFTLYMCCVGSLFIWDRNRGVKQVAPQLSSRGGRKSMSRAERLELNFVEQRRAWVRMELGFCFALLFVFVFVWIAFGVSMTNEFPNGDNTLTLANSHNEALLTTVIFACFGFVFQLVFVYAMGQLSKLSNWWGGIDS